MSNIELYLVWGLLSSSWVPELFRLESPLRLLCSHQLFLTSPPSSSFHTPKCISVVISWKVSSLSITFFHKEILYLISFFFIFYCYSSTVVSIFLPPLCPWALYTWSLMTLSLLSPLITFPPPLWLLSVCSVFQCLWLYFACLSVLLIRFHL